MEKTIVRESEKGKSSLDSWETHWDATAKPKTSILPFSPSFVSLFWTKPEAEQHGEHTGALTGETSYLNPFTSRPVAAGEGLECEMMSFPSLL